MVTAKRIQVTLTGGAPWGFRLSGGGTMPLAINKIRKKSAAHTSGLKEGDSVISINGIPVYDKTQDEALELVEYSGDCLTLEIFRGDMADDLSRNKPKKTIKIGGVGVGVKEAKQKLEGGLTLTATVGDVSNAPAAANVTPVVNADTSSSSELILTTSIDDVSSDSFVTADSGGGGIAGFTVNVGEVSESSFDNTTTNSGFTMTASADDPTSSSSIMVDSITAEVGDLVSAGVELQAAPAYVSPNLAQPFMDSNVIAVSPSHLSPQPPRGSLSPKPVSFSPKPVSLSPKPVSLSPKPVSLSPKPVSLSPKPKAPSPKSPIPPPTSPKPVATSPKPSTLQPIVQNSSPKPFIASPPPPTALSPQPSNISSTITTSTETFDDGQGQFKRERIVTTTTSQTESKANNQNVAGPGKIVTKRDTKTTVTTKTGGSSLVTHQDSAFDTPIKTKKITQTQTQTQPLAMKKETATTTRDNTTTTATTTTNKINNNNNNLSSTKSRNGPVPFTAPAPVPASLTDKVIVNTAPLHAYPVKPMGNAQPLTPAPVFKPSKFVMGRSPRKDIPLNYHGSSQLDVSMHKDGKENVQPMFQVTNIVGEKGKKRRDIWKPNVWLPGQQPQQQQRKQQQEQLNVKTDFSPYNTFPVPQLQHGVSLAEQPRSRSDSRHRYEIENSYNDEYDEVDNHGQVRRPSKLHIFGPPVEIHALPDDSGYPDSPYSPYLPYREDGEIDMGMAYEEGPSSPDSSDIRRRKNLYSDSAFYNTPGKSYPTINEQMKLCKIIASSLTSQANRRARGAKMFMKRKRKSNKWIHDGHSEWSSSAGDVANIHDLDSELSVDDGGNKPLFYFKIPNLKNRISSADRKMALTQEQFERLRLQSHKCDHKNVPPTTCFNIVEDLKSSRGRGGRMFEKRKVRVEKYVVDDKNARHARPRGRLEKALNTPVRQEKTPWEAAIQHGGNVDAAFSHIDEMDRNQKLNQILKYPAPKKVSNTPRLRPVVKVETPHFNSSLRSDSSATLLKGKNFNRTALGWGGGGEYPVADKLLSIPAPAKKSRAPSAPVGFTPMPATPLLPSTPNYGNYNPQIKAWKSPGTSPYVTSTGTQQAPPQQQSSRRQHQEPWGHQSWHSDVQQVQRPVDLSEKWKSQDDLQARPKSWVSDSYEVPYKEEYDYTYVPVDYKFAEEDYPSSPAYKQPIIPGTDL